MNTARWLALVLFLCPFLPPPEAAAAGWIFGPARLNKVNRRLHGQLIDYTRNHGADRRIWSPSLCEKRDVYVYLPPDFDPSRRYPLVIWLHGFAQDEQSFRDDIVEHLDAAMACGKLPPAIVVAPDGSLSGHPCIKTAGSFFINSRAGRFEDYVMQDIWDFAMESYPIRPEREAHVLAGASMGGGAAFNLAFKYRDRVKTVFAFFPPLNARWIDCHGKYRGNFDPCCWDWQTKIRPCMVIGRFYGVITVRVKDIIGPLYDRRDDILGAVISENPAEMLEAYDVKEGELAMYVAYGGRDQFNIDAQVESFLYLARERGLTVQVGYDPKGKHDKATALRLMPDLFHWFSTQAPAEVPPLPKYPCPGR